MRIYSTVQLCSITSLWHSGQSRGCRFESLWGFGFCLKIAHYEVGYCGKKTYLAGLQCTLTSSCAMARLAPEEELTDAERAKMYGAATKSSTTASGADNQEA